MHPPYSKPAGITKLSPAGSGSVMAYELDGNFIVGKLFGVFPFKLLGIEHVETIRLATRKEIPPTVLQQLTKSPDRAIYLIQCDNGEKLFLNLEGRGHFKLSQAIARYHNQLERMAAA